MSYTLREKRVFLSIYFHCCSPPPPPKKSRGEDRIKQLWNLCRMEYYVVVKNETFCKKNETNVTFCDKESMKLRAMP